MFVGFLFTAVLLVLSSLLEKKKSAGSPESVQGISVVQSLIIGFAQGVGTLPGISRSGSTISAALFCGVERCTAGEFSFIVSIPAIIGAFILELHQLGSVTSVIGVAPVAVGCSTAFVSGYFALA